MRTIADAQGNYVGHGYNSTEDATLTRYLLNILGRTQVIIMSFGILM